MSESNLRTTLYSSHVSMGARIVPFGGWDMPVQYSSILAEVKAVRTASGVFDVSHMGRLYISGPQAAEFLDWALTGSAANLRVGRARYCFICNEQGGVIDDTIFYRLAEDRYLLIPNAGNRPAVVRWFQGWIDRKFASGCQMIDRTTETALIALQGPDAAAIMDEATAQPISELRPFAWREGNFLGKLIMVGRTGYTGEDGFEMVTDAADADFIWTALTQRGVIPCGLGARDVLRLEAALPLHGHELDTNTTPIEAGLERFVRFDKEYVGSPVLKRQREEGVARKLIGMTMPGRSAPRAEYPILRQGQRVGQVTSGSFSPTLDICIALGFVQAEYATPGQQLEVDIRGRPAPVEVVALPFYAKSR